MIDDLKRIIAQHWGFSTLRPLQEQAMRAVLQGRDSLVVLPTGGGKSLCYQAPAVLRGDTTVVVSPLISLMKDQVDGLRACGVAATQIDSSQSAAERSAYELDIAQGAVRLVFVSPERLVTSSFQTLLRRIDVRAFAIDEAHCISHWGHDFRPEYRQLKRLNELFPQASVHAYTATATERVRKDIVTQLGLRQPEVLVGNFDRPNLNYRVLLRQSLDRQVREVLDRHPKEAGIIYCIRRKDVDGLTDLLRASGYKAQAYHAGLDAQQRKETQDAFAAEQCDLVVATVAFGMGIDRSNIRFVLHTGMPKSIEHYQQETGRAGRDGLEAECVLLHSGEDVMTWKFIIQKSAQEPGVDPNYLPSALQHLNDMDRYARGAICRHRALVNYFGQNYEPATCRACDLCLEDTEPVPEANVIAQKILSCVARVKERFGAAHVASVLRGENTEAIRKWKHEDLSTYGLLREQNKADVRDWIYQLIGQNVLVQELQDGQFAILRLNAASWEVMRKQRDIRLVQPARKPGKQRPEKSRADTASWEGVDRDLFEALRAERRSQAERKSVPPYVIFSDTTLRELARVRPSSLKRMRLVYGIGTTKLQEFGAAMLQIITEHCRKNNVAMDVAVRHTRPAEPVSTSTRPNPQRDLAFKLFRHGASFDDVVARTNRTRATVTDYLAEWIRAERPSSIAAWVPRDVYDRVAAAAQIHGTDRLKPIFIALDEKVPYEAIRAVIAHQQVL